MRHAITKLSHLHFVAARPYAERVVQLGEDPSRVYVAGAAAIESIRSLKLPGRGELALSLGVPLEAPLASLTFHPASLDAGAAGGQARELSLAIEDVFESGTVIVSLPNDDPGNAAVREELGALAERRDNVHAFESLGQLRYLSLLSHADVVVGNSSSGVLEAPAFRVPVVNVGDRQRGRLMAANVIHAEPERAAVGAALRRALDPAFRESVARMENPFGEGETSRVVVDVLASADLAALRDKRFHDLPDGPWREGVHLGGAS
jgi:UDP-hydrolysing UDP-N-acetyl-D-glucosamine 2-epimerase